MTHAKAVNIDFKELFTYDETSPSHLRWKIDSYSGKYYQVAKTKVGDVAGYLSQGYWRVQYKRRSYLVHRVIYQMIHGEIPARQVIDHYDQDSQNNSPENLMLKTKQHNCQNSSMNSNNTSGVTGVYIQNTHKGKYQLFVAEVRTLEGKKIQKAFSINKYGREQAFVMACEYRKKLIEELNMAGADYTPKHGK